MREQDDAEIVFPCLNADGGNVADVFACEYDLELLEAAARERRQGLCHFRYAAKSDKSAATVGQIADVVSGAAFFELGQKLGRKPALHRRQNAAPWLGDQDDGAPCGQGSNQPVENALEAGHKVRGRE